MIEYCKPNELLVGDLAGIDDMKVDYVRIAGDEMDAMIGFVYLLPLSGWSVHVGLLLKNIARKLASGRLLLAQAVGSEDTSVHAYGQSLVDDAMRDLWMIRNGQIDLGLPKVAFSATGGDSPSIIEGDTFSGVDAFYTWLDRPWWAPRPIGFEWRPGVKS